MPDNPKDIKTYFLNSGSRPPDKCMNNQDHDFVITERPSNNQSGWHKKECSKCHIKVCWDDSD